MFVFIMDQYKDTHVVDFKNVQGKYRTLCGKNFFQNQNITTLGADNTFNGICPICKKYYDEMYLSDLEESVRLARSRVTHHKNFRSFHQHNFLGPKVNYEDAWERVWTKLSRAKSITKNKSYKYYGK